MDSLQNYSSQMNNSTSNSKTFTTLRIIYICILLLFIIYFVMYM